MSSKDLCTIDRLSEIMPYVDALKIEGRSKSEFYVGSIVKAYKHVRDAIVNKTPIDENIKDLVNQIPHRSYWDGFLLNKMKDQIPDGEPEETCSIADNKNAADKSLNSISLDSAGPLFARNYFGLVKDEFIEHEGNKYYAFVAKEVIEP